MIFGRVKKQIIQGGATFRRVLPSQVIETAEVDVVAPNSSGIPHVTYRVRFEAPSGGLSAMTDKRVLALDSFETHYKGCRVA
ncbi:MAG: hypothetical protein U1E97_12760 [Alphaproteobacteria bacterium]